MTWSATSYNNFVNEITKLGGIKAAASRFGWNERAIESYVNLTRLPNHNTRCALAAQLGLPLSIFA